MLTFTKNPNLKKQKTTNVALTWPLATLYPIVSALQYKW